MWCLQNLVFQGNWKSDLLNHKWQPQNPAHLRSGYSNAHISRKIVCELVFHDLNLYLKIYVHRKWNMFKFRHNSSMHFERAYPCTYYALQTHSKCVFNEMFGAECLFLSSGFHSDLLVEQITYQTAIFWNSAPNNLLRIILKHFSLWIQDEKVFVQSCIRRDCFAAGSGGAPHAH